MNLIGERKDPVKPQHKQSEYKSQLGPKTVQDLNGPYWMPDGNSGFAPCPMVLIEEELVRFLRIPELSKARDYHNVDLSLGFQRLSPVLKAASHSPVSSLSA